MDAKTLEKKINEKYGKNSSHAIDENVNLIRKLETAEIVFLDSMSSMDGHHLLKDAPQKEIDRIAKHLDLEDDLDENEFIPD